MEILGIDIGGTGMKGALVDTKTGKLTTERFRVPTPKSRKPEDMATVFKTIVAHFNYKGPVGCGFPTITQHGVCKSVGNLHPSWLNVNIKELFSKACGLPVTVINDADAAGFAVMNYGIGKGEKGLVVIITIGTGLGSGAFYNGKLIPNFELGQIPYKKHMKIEQWAAASVKKRKNLSYKKWAKRFNTFLKLVEIIICPDLIILGGGTSKKYGKFKKWIKINTPVKAAHLGNHAGIIGAATAVTHET
ncbi:polyphosphate--glucose phosphotransferase [Jejuia pallidilutea]|jgi:polyphosphate glucokinase|uniref:Polyphosphate glucokinase n=1 Tax=Jejuia pallidilutea TaxID=504487 RepID=A0A090W4E9_9FLAO|nr:ROK family protein [Jejuia pallidilutea]GAL66136.1 polyphosphate glucokinase [Jejuia pallidilutea]GAL71083.1 polyphosphate glucokinase [Jejuia pallidilutea]GAL88168.1 polyphosphate glucokinase [Jejuia pallidilutea]